MRTTPLVIVCSTFLVACFGGADAPSEPSLKSEVVQSVEEAELVELPGTDTLTEAAEPKSTAGPPEAAAEVAIGSSEARAQPTHRIVIRSGENLVLLAGWAGTTPTDLAELNEMDVQATLFAGSGLNIVLTDEEFASFSEKRGVALDARLDRYIEKRGGLYTVEAHSMRSGETVWAVAKNLGGLPMWVVSAFNEDLDLNELGIGDIVTLPVMVDTVQASLEAGIDSEEAVEEVEPF